MRNACIAFMILLIGISCGKDKTISEELVGEWLYERETFNSFSSFEDPDTEGFISLRSDETGNWSPASGFLSFGLEWDLQAEDTKISITKSLIGLQEPFPSNTLYDITRQDEDNFTFTFHLKFDSAIDTLEAFERFENIILTRMK